MKRNALTLLALAALALPLAAQAPRPFTIPDVMSAPFASELVAAPKGDAFAWLVTEHGVRNVWLAAAPDWRGRRLTGYEKEDGQELSELAFTADGSTLLFTRGGEPNRQGEIPNPTSDPKGAEQAVWAVAVAGGAPRRLGEGHEATPLPDGRVALVRDGKVLVAPQDAGGEAKPLFKARGRAMSLRVSPDGASLAFVSRRERHSLIGLYSLAADTLRWLDPSVDRDFAPVFSPDGSRLAFLRVPVDPHPLAFVPEREGPPFSIRVVDLENGVGRELFRARPGRGSVFRGVVGDDLWWASGDRLVFPWEADGWTHLYAIAASGGTPLLLTPGAFEVEHVALAPGGREVVYSSNQDDVDRRHVWRVPVAGGAPVALTRGDGLEWAPAPLADGSVALLRSDARRSSRAARVAQGALADVSGPSVPPEFPGSALVVPQPVLLSAADGLVIHGQLFLPPAGKPGERHPAVVFFHGGSRRQMLLGWHYMLYYHNAYALNQYLASRGFVVLSVNYRSGIGYGLDFREAVDYGAHGASEFNDVLGAGLYLRGRSDVDPHRIGLWGGSYGGYLTALGLARASDLFSAGVDFHGVHDWNGVIRNFVPSYDPEARRGVARLAFESSPLASVDTWRSPVLLIHGDDDRNVPFQQTLDLVAALRARGVDCEELVFPDEIHDFLLQSDWTRAYERAAEFLGRKLMAP
jgi:dipeptidyl aminopeptidase/acylaminoacyl peptidase